MLAQSYEEILIPPNISVEKVENKSKIQKKRRSCLTTKVRQSLFYTQNLKI